MFDNFYIWTKNIFDNFYIRNYDIFDKIDNLSFGNFPFEKLNIDKISLYLINTPFAATHLSNQNYDICFRRNLNMCILCFSPNINLLVSAAINQVLGETIFKTFKKLIKNGCCVLKLRTNSLFCLSVESTRHFSAYNTSSICIKIS
jgi:hypothetical protein